MFFRSHWSSLKPLSFGFIIPVRQPRPLSLQKATNANPGNLEPIRWELAMKMRFHNSFGLRALLLLLVACAPVAAQQPYPTAAQQTTAQPAPGAAPSQNAPQTSPQNSQAVSQT